MKVQGVPSRQKGEHARPPLARPRPLGASSSAEPKQDQLLASRPFHELPQDSGRDFPHQGAELSASEGYNMQNTSSLQMLRTLRSEVQDLWNALRAQIDKVSSERSQGLPRVLSRPTNDSAPLAYEGQRQEVPLRQVLADAGVDPMPRWSPGSSLTASLTAPPVPHPSPLVATRAPPSVDNRSIMMTAPAPAIVLTASQAGRLSPVTPSTPRQAHSPRWGSPAVPMTPMITSMSGGSTTWLNYQPAVVPQGVASNPSLVPLQYSPAHAISPAFVSAQAPYSGVLRAPYVLP